MHKNLPQIQLPPNSILAMCLEPGVQTPEHHVKLRESSVVNILRQKKGVPILDCWSRNSA